MHILLSLVVNVVHRVGHQIAAPVEYHDRCQMETWAKTDSTPDMFPEYRCLPNYLFTTVKDHRVLFQAAARAVQGRDEAGGCGSSQPRHHLCRHCHEGPEARIHHDQVRSGACINNNED